MTADKHGFLRFTCSKGYQSQRKAKIMLRSFRVANHKSIRDEQELLLMPAYDKARPVVPVAGIFGANASGKSNLLDALGWMQGAVRTSFARWEAGSGVPRQPFRLESKAAAEKSGYVVDLLIDGVQFVYGFAVDDERVVEEWLYSYPERRKRVIFERELDEIAFGSTVSDGRSRAKMLESLTRPNCLALSAAAQANQDAVMPIYHWFRAGLRLMWNDARSLRFDISRVKEALAHYTSLVDLLRAADLGIRDLRVDGDAATDAAKELATIIPKLNAASRQRRDLMERLAQLRADYSGGRSEVATLEKKLADATETEESLEKSLARHRSAFMESQARLVFVHGDSAVPMTVDDQSAGTISWLQLLLDTVDVLATGGVLVVDEIDASLHPRLTARLVELFRDERSNPKLAQLIFTTHDATLLGTSFGRDILARDEIWFVEKDVKTSATSLFALTDFQPRQEDSRVRRYLGGSYGAVPAVFSNTLVRTLLEPEALDAA